MATLLSSRITKNSSQCFRITKDGYTPKLQDYQGYYTPELQDDQGGFQMFQDNKGWWPDGPWIRHYFYLTLNKPLKVDISLFSPAIICLFSGITGAVSHYHRADTQIGYSSSSLIIISKRDYWLSKKFKLKTNLLWFLQARRLATVLKYSSYANML